MFTNDPTGRFPGMGGVGLGGPARLLPGPSTPGIAAGAIIGNIGRPDIYFGVPVGSRGIPLQSTRARVSDVVPETRRAPVRPDLPAIDRRDQPSVTIHEEQLVIVDDWFEYHKEQNQGKRVLHRPSGTVWGGGRPSRPTDRTTNAQQPGGEDMDLGTLATDLLRQAGTAYIQRELGPRTQPVRTQAVSYQPAFDIPFTDMGVEADIPFIDIVDKTKCKRKRRRPIATPSEISQLASLKQVASPGEVKLFLAKRLRT